MHTNSCSVLACILTHIAMCIKSVYMPFNVKTTSLLMYSQYYILIEHTDVYCYSLHTNACTRTHTHKHNYNLITSSYMHVMQYYKQ